MWKLALMVSLLAPIACTTPNPKACGDGNCTDPSFPFCDVNGSLGGAPGECIAVTCAASEFAECRGDVEVRCNSDGTNYELVQCERGCETGTGCRLCDPNETACTNGAVATCDANGTVVSRLDCPLGCFEDEARCRDIAPSNDLGVYLDMVANPPDLDLSAGGMIDVDDGMIVIGGTVVPVPTFLLPGSSGGAPIRVFVVGDAVLGDVAVATDGQFAEPALALLSNGRVQIAGQLTVTTGDITSNGCSGGAATHTFVSPQDHATGAGGGAHATKGGHGGSLPDRVGPLGGTPQGSESLIPLRGGCASGGQSSNVGPNSLHGARGGGALQVSARSAIVVSGSIVVRGQDGATVSGFEAAIGGGAGGGVLLEAPTVELSASAVIDARGGDGGGLLCDPPFPTCGKRGLGATSQRDATDGGNITMTSRRLRAGAGGGGLGRIRINTETGAFTNSSTSVIEGQVSSSTVSTR